MYTDAQNRFSNNQAVTTGTQVSTNALDLLSANSNIGIGAKRQVVVQVTAPLVGGTSVRAEFIQSANANLSSPDVLAVGPTVAVANLTAGAKLLDIAAPNTTKRYVGVQYVSVGTFTSGTVFAGIVAETDHNPYVPANTGY